LLADFQRIADPLPRNAPIARVSHKQALECSEPTVKFVAGAEPNLVRKLEVLDHLVQLHNVLLNLERRLICHGRRP